EINEAAALVADAVHPEANIISGATIDDALGDEVRVTVIAAGFDGGMPKRRDEGTVLRRQQPQQTQAETREAAQALAAQRAAATPAQAPAQPAGQPQQQAPAQPAAQPRQQSAPHQGAPQQSQRPQQPAQPRQAPRPVQFDDDDLDVPDFLK